MESGLLRIMCIGMIIISIMGIFGCSGASPGARPHTAAATTISESAPGSVRPVHESTPTDVCATTQRDLSAAMDDLQITDFAGWELSFTADQTVGGASITGDASEIAAAFKTTSSLMAALGSSNTLVARTVSGDLSDIGSDMDDLLSGSGTVSDEATVVHAYTAAAAAAMAICGPDSFTKYAPAQVKSLDAINDLGGNYSGYIGSLDDLVTDSRAQLSRERQFAALGPQGNGGSCQVAYEMTNVVGLMVQGDGGQFNQHVREFETDAGLTEQDVAALNRDLSEIRNEGLSAPTGADTAIYSTRSLISRAMTSINKLIDIENTLASEAASMANAMAKIPAKQSSPGLYFGTCEQYGPGKISLPLLSRITLEEIIQAAP